MATRSVWPPETSSTTRGSSRSGSSRKAPYRWASRWFTATKGTSHTSASDLAALTSPACPMPRVRPGPFIGSPAPVAAHRRLQPRLQGVEPSGVVVGVDVVDPHDQSVLVGLGVVVLADASGLEPEPVVERLGDAVGDPDLEGEVARTPASGQPGHVEHEPGADLVPLPGGVDGDGGHVGVGAAEHQARVADHRALGPG